MLFLFSQKSKNYRATHLFLLRITLKVKWSWHTLLMPAARTQRQVDLYELWVSLVYRTSSRAARATQINTVSKNREGGRKRRRKGRGERVNLIQIKWAVKGILSMELNE